MAVPKVKIARENYIEFLLELKDNGVPLSKEQISFLKENGKLNAPFKISKKEHPNQQRKEGST